MDSGFEAIHAHHGSSSDGGAGSGAGGVVAGAGSGSGSGPAAVTTAATTTTTSQSFSHSPHAGNNHNQLNTSAPGSSSPPSKQSILHNHRQSHNSSKLPAFRFADLKRESIALPALLHASASPVSPDPDQRPETHPNTTQETQQTQQTKQTTPPLTTHRRQRTLSNNSATRPVSPELSLEQFSPVRSRKFTFTSQTPAASSPATSPRSGTRTTLLDTTTATNTDKVANAVPNHLANVLSPSESFETIVLARPPLGRAPATITTTTALGATGDAQTGLLGDETTKEWAQGQRELLLPKTLQRSVSDDSRRHSITRRPPVSYRPPLNSNASGGTASIPPIRSFRSSGERRSLVLDMNFRSPRAYDTGDEYGDSHHRDTTLRALEGRRGDDAQQITPPDSARDVPDGDDGGDLFLKIAREDPSRRAAAGKGIYTDNQSAVSRVSRSARRPLSLAVSSSYIPISPPQMSRRLSDQQETSRSRGFSNDQSAERVSRALTYKGHSREKQSDEIRSRVTSTPLRGSPLTPRSLTFQDVSTEPSSAYNRRRQPSVDAGSAVPSRMSSLKQANAIYNQPRAYNSSPLVPKSADPQKHDTHTGDASQGVEGTSSTASTAAPSTVWDELDDLKSRIHRLELTGKLPPTSGAAMSRASDERPATAHTTATTMSASPKRVPASVMQSADSPAGHKDVHPLLYSALAKSKDFLSSDVYGALETATADALALSSMMGTSGQPGPISSGASGIGSISGGATVTDRQLRRKADSVCRSLTELCLALSEGAAQLKAQQVTTPPEEEPTVTISPTITRFSGMASQRRPSAAAERSLALNTSPITLTRFEDKRNSALMSSALPSPRYSSAAPATPTETTTTGRRTSLLLSRSRRAGTEEPDEGRRSSILRTRRAGTEEPEDHSDRRLLLTRGRRGTVNGDEDDTRFRTPSRAVTEVHGVRSGNREYNTQLPTPATREPNPPTSSGLPRRQPTSGINTRLAQPAAASAIATPSRRYFDRPTPTRETVILADRPAEDRPQPQRQFSLARAGSLNKRGNRESMIATPSPGASGYR
ncbi:Uu.00g058760.m01.CDS01 [Anthostomella pinea]|uniref:Uu.00g058760.m01.CDS01 n=1 Tax=Anthostomella pinea TaxID=933095 RepID=A0AAI8YJW4_9PEZI|nr:Uu.00g058760.m01.CDS01 [Anthostomella pinea]